MLLRPAPAENKTTLTNIEIQGLRSPFNFSDGHAYHDLFPFYEKIIQRLPELWLESTRASIPEMEAWFKKVFADFFNLEALRTWESFNICPTASNSIDLVGAWARSQGVKVGLVEPTFDNLALLLRRREVELQPLTEGCIRNPLRLRQEIDRHGLNAVFTVDPNNPTGTRLSEEKFREVVKVCVETDTTLIVDRTFRVYASQRYDDYAICKEMGAKYIVIEDTGKSWPTLDMKASILAYSKALASQMQAVYFEVYLCVSNFALALIGTFIDETNRNGGPRVILDLVKERRADVVEALKGTGLEVLPSEPTCHMSICWISCRALGMTDEQLIKYLCRYGISVLPGRHFYWGGRAPYGSDRIRLSLLKPSRAFHLGLQSLRRALLDLSPVSASMP